MERSRIETGEVQHATRVLARTTRFSGERTLAHPSATPLERRRCVAMLADTARQRPPPPQAHAAKYENRTETATESPPHRTGRPRPSTRPLDNRLHPWRSHLPAAPSGDHRRTTGQIEQLRVWLPERLGRVDVRRRLTRGGIEEHRQFVGPKQQHRLGSHISPAPLKLRHPPRLAYWPLTATTSSRWLAEVVPPRPQISASYPVRPRRAEHLEGLVALRPSNLRKG